MEKLINYPDVKEIYEHIYLIENFITEEESKKLVNFGDFGDWDSFKHDSGDPEYTFWDKKLLPLDNTSFFDFLIEISKKQSSLFYNQYKIEGNSLLQRQTIGQSMQVHADNSGLENPQYNNDKTIWGLVLYINDFNGGEIYYPNIGLEYKPKMGDLVIHPASIKYEHGTKPVLEGPNRYIMTSFAKIIYF